MERNFNRLKKKCCLKTNGDIFFGILLLFFPNKDINTEVKHLLCLEYSFDYCVRKHRAMKNDDFQ